jgi:hypothetical protein
MVTMRMRFSMLCGLLGVHLGLDVLLAFHECVN